MSYENPPQPEGINVSADRPLRDFFVLLAIVLVVSVAAIVLLASAASSLAARIPFSAELYLTEQLGEDWLPGGDSTATDPDVLEREAYLRALAQRLARHMDFPEGLEPRVHYLPGETVNAFATLGGRVVFFEGLVSQLPSENALALVLAHELAHLQLRHPIVAAGRGLTVSLALAATFGLADNAVVAQLVEWIGVTSTLSYSRDQEREADALAAQVVLAEYGHLRGARGLFDLFRDESGESSALVPDFRSTHPSIDERIQWLLTYAEEQGPMDHETAPITPLPWAQTP